jgi:hypothetical protein
MRFARTITLALILPILAVALARGDYLGSWDINDYVTVTATTHRFSSGAAYAATGDVHLDIYEDSTTTQIVDDTDMTAFDSVTGLYLARVQLLAATGFEAGKHYTCVIAATVDGVSGIATHNFQIQAKTNVVAVDGNTATVDAFNAMFDPNGLPKVAIHDVASDANGLIDTNDIKTAAKAGVIELGGTEALFASLTSAYLINDMYAIVSDLDVDLGDPWKKHWQPADYNELEMGGLLRFIAGKR